MCKSQKETKPKLKLWTLKKVMGGGDFLMRRIYHSKDKY